MQQVHNVKDLLWKALATGFAKNFVRFFYQNADAIFDLDKEIIHLNTEVVQFPGDREIIKEASRVDGLMKVTLLENEQGHTHMLLKCEVHARADKNYPRHVYNNMSILNAQYYHPVTVLIIYTETPKYFRAGLMELKLPRMRLEFEFEPFVLSDQDETALERHPNPVALGVLAALLYKTCPLKNDAELLKRKIRLVNNLKARNLSSDDAAALLTFIFLYRDFEKIEAKRKFEEVLELLNLNQSTMNFMDIYKLHCRIEALKEGKKEGRREGAEEKARIFIENLIKTGGFSLKQIAAMGNVPLKFVKGIEKEMSAPAAG